MFPTREEAEELLREAESCNPGAWANHSRVTAMCAGKIAENCPDMDEEKAYILGLLHDIGRKFGVKHFGHIYDGWQYMLQLEYDEVARICLTHSFSVQKIEDYIGRFDVTREQQRQVEEALAATEYDDYDRLIQLCDSLAGAEGVMKIEERMADVKRRYGSYPQDKWEQNLALKAYFEEKLGKAVYEVIMDGSKAIHINGNR
ncbi:MAG: HD domain-containing protein [Roseburia sp.]|nr:HD domain-containing protein [Roseburia sp.]